jgi:hypothetical protein
MGISGVDYSSGSGHHLKSQAPAVRAGQVGQKLVGVLLLGRFHR